MYKLRGNCTVTAQACVLAVMVDYLSTPNSSMFVKLLACTVVYLTLAVSRHYTPTLYIVSAKG